MITVHARYHYNLEVDEYPGMVEYAYLYGHNLVRSGRFNPRLLIYGMDLYMEIEKREDYLRYRNFKLRVHCDELMDIITIALINQKP